MPPRKKPASTADGAAPVPTRTSARNKAKADASQVTAAAAVASPPPAAPLVKPRSKRARASSTVADDGKGANKPASKKAKTEDRKDDDDDNAATASISDPQGSKDEKTDDEPKKLVTVLKRGLAPVDPVSGKVATHQVYHNEQGVWDAMLNQTDVGNNANKFYVLQLLHPLANNSDCILFTRWGRVGENGQHMTKGPWPASHAIVEFKKQFKAKAAVNWENRVGMVARKGKYTWLERDFSNEEDKANEEKDRRDQDDIIIPDSKLEDEVQQLCRLIFNTNLLNAHLSAMNYDARKLPLGKLSKNTILSGFAALKKLSEVLEKPDGETAKEYGGFLNAVETLSNSYYSIIPHDFGRTRPIVLNHLDRLKKELELVDALGDMEVASKIISSSIPKDEQGNPINPVDANFRSLGLTSMELVARGSKEFNALQAYTRDTHGATHRHYSIEILNAYRVERGREAEVWAGKGYGNYQNQRMLLWHGSRTTNFVGILKQGLRIAPPEAPVTGYMFGKGVYFADMVSKSANYCYASLSNNTGLLLLCDVVVMPCNELLNSDYYADERCRASGKMATKGVGRTQPVDWQDAGEALDNDELKGCQMPAGPGKDIHPPGAQLQYNEYIVYDASQIRVKYLLMVKM